MACGLLGYDLVESGLNDLFIGVLNKRLFSLEDDEIGDEDECDNEDDVDRVDVDNGDNDEVDEDNEEDEDDMDIWVDSPDDEPDDLSFIMPEIDRSAHQCSISNATNPFRCGY